MSGYNNRGILIIIALNMASSVSAQITGASFLENDPSPRAFSLGGSNVVTSWGSQSVNANPANLGLTSQRFELFSAYAQPMESVQYGYLSGAVSLSPLKHVPVDAIGFSIVRQQIGGLQGTDNAGNPNGNSFGSADMAVSLGVSGRIMGALRYGAAAKAITSSLAGVNSNTTLASDLGLSCSFRQFHDISVGAGVNNLGQGIRYLNQTDRLPTSASLGAALPFGPAMLAASINQMIYDRTTSVGVGMEYAVGPLSLRGGYSAQRGIGTNLALKDQSGMGQFMNGMSGGIGLQVGAARLDYALSAGAVELGANQKVSLTVAWGQKQAPIAKSARPNTRVIQQPWKSENSDSRQQIDWQLIR